MKAKHIVQFGSEMIKLGAHAFKYGKVITDKTETQRRLSICRQCPYYSVKENRCDLCGCKMKFKAVLASSKCPLEEPKW